ncbi:flagellar biosynthesis protein FliQ [Hydrogenovibrio sp. JE_KL2]|jgi:flagellar biosynthetic protein FliQ|uniref:flagellar biosynthesis protein FliQ n=1 Tax=Hydrogenovibrio sp. JE_KL2 TaxID=2651188 RepID=UPI00128E8728|nr:flagellar biosynthesis protein FliQ [Hydrogenovibrio sp. JE_KL2]MBD3821211.1 flagellar biosynthesis protein FliQ [Thiotrichales bacterium]MBN2606753.1 flagellar biosynthesis protein FliQ [Thiotrichales bacterium]MPQ75663.1 flagellar biosynthesis protein FliQ [Hydrogenovibrio sp. JE_KL2]
MTPEFVLTLGQRMLEVVAMLSVPLLLPALAVGLLVGMFQAATQINEMTLSFIPKVAAVGVVLVIGGPWMLTTLISFTKELFQNIPALIG